MEQLCPSVRRYVRLDDQLVSQRDAGPFHGNARELAQSFRNGSLLSLTAVLLKRTIKRLAGGCVLHGAPLKGAFVRVEGIVSVRTRQL